MKTKLLSLLLLLSVLLGMFPISAAAGDTMENPIQYLTLHMPSTQPEETTGFALYVDSEEPAIQSGASDPTATQVYNAMMALKSTYPEGMTFTNDTPFDMNNPYVWKGGRYYYNGIWYNAGVGCHAFAMILSDAAFGTASPTVLLRFTYDDIRVGDILRINNDTHSVIVTKKTSTEIRVAQANMGSKVYWDWGYTKAEIMSKLDYILTRYTHTHTKSSSMIENSAATCTTSGENVYYCTKCLYIMERQTIPALDHSWTQTASTSVTCYSDGAINYICSRCSQTKAEIIPSPGHSWTETVMIPPTCTSSGIGIKSCSECGTGSTYDIPATGHSWDGGVVTTEATYSAPGLMTVSCTNCSNYYTIDIPQLENPFTDVAEGRFYYTPVMWAVDNGITTGITDTTFGPDATCTRAQFVTFLWRLAGKPEPRSSNTAFTDLKKSASYYKAVLWAAENGITTGITDTTFCPNNICTRGQVVTFLWRYAGKPTARQSYNPFEDVSSDRFYYSAVLWAVEQGITTGITDTTFVPDGNCTRGHTVTFLYRFAN